jgi:hypothetical protein
MGAKERPLSPSDRNFELAKKIGGPPSYSNPLSLQNGNCGWSRKSDRVSANQSTGIPSTSNQTMDASIYQHHSTTHPSVHTNRQTGPISHFIDIRIIPTDHAVLLKKIIQERTHIGPRP